MAEEKTTALAELIKRLPGGSFKRAADVAITTFEKCISPLSEVLGGWGEIIKARFSAKLEHEKLLAAETYAKASAKIAALKETPTAPKNVNVYIAVLDIASSETDEVKRELLSNALTNEIVDADVHPEILRLLTRLDQSDIRVLSEIAQKDQALRESAQDKRVAVALSEVLSSISIDIMGLSLSKRVMAKHYTPNAADFSFSESLLLQLGLVERSELNSLRVTSIGREFIRCVTDPTMMQRKKRERKQSDKASSS